MIAISLVIAGIVVYPYSGPVAIGLGIAALIPLVFGLLALRDTN